jgi:hypothetical protein
MQWSDFIAMILPRKVLSLLVVLSCVGIDMVTRAQHGDAPPTLVIFVATDGDDAWSGRLPSVNASRSDGPIATLERARDMIRERRSAGPLPAGGVVVELRGGRYQLEQAFRLELQDSGEAESPVIYRASEGEEVCLAGGLVIDHWRSVNDPNVLALLEPRAADKVLEADVVPRTGEIGRVMPGPGWGASSPGLELFFCNQPMTLARWPNEGFVRVGAVLGPTRMGENISHGCQEGVFTLDSERPKRWAGAKDIMLHGFWAHDWADQRLRVAAIDAGKRVITLDPEPRHAFGFRSNQWFYAYNLLAELDRPGEWYLDRDSSKLYFWPPAPISSGTAMVSMLTNLVTMDNVANVTLRGLTFEVCRDTAIVVSRGVGICVAGCTIRNAGGWALDMNGQKSGAIGCDIYNVGSGGVALSGGDRQTLTRGDLYLENCHLFRFGRWNPINKPGVRVDGVGSRIAHNLFHDSPHAAAVWAGNDHIFEFNEFHSVVQGANDAGIMYAGYSPSMRGNVIRYNYFHDVYGFEGRGCNGVYLDDMFCSAAIFGNVFCRVPRAVFIGGGQGNTVENNIFVDCGLAVWVDARMLTWAAASKPIMKQRLEEVPFREEPWRTRYPELLRYLEDDYAVPRDNVVARNVSWRGVWESVEPLAKPGVRFTDNLVGVDPRFVDERNRDFAMLPDSPVWKIGFTRIPTEKIGLYRSSDRATWPVAHTVQQRPKRSLESIATTIRHAIERFCSRKRLLAGLAFGCLIVSAALHMLRLTDRRRRIVVLIMCARWGFAAVALLAFVEVSARYVSLPRRQFLWAASLLAVTTMEVFLARARRAFSPGQRSAEGVATAATQENSPPDR